MPKENLNVAVKAGISKSNKWTIENMNIGAIFRKYGLGIVLVIMVVALSIVSESFFTSENLINVIRQISINGILALGMTFVILTGGIDLSVGSLVAVAGVVTGSIINNSPDSVGYAFFAGILVCAIFGMVSGLMVAKFNIAPFVATLSVMTIARGFSLVYSDGRPYVLTSKAFEFFGKGYMGPIPIPVVILVAVTILMGVLLYFTKFGRYVCAVGGNENAAKVSGVNINKVKITVYTLCGALSGLAGVILASRINSGQPAIGNGYELDAVAAVVIGGTSLTGGVGSVIGTVMGFVIIGIINNGLNLLNVSSYYQLIVKGAIIAGAVILDQKTKKS